MIAKALEAFGDIHILVNNAGTWNESTTFDLDDARFDAEFATHVKGTMGATSAAVSAMREAGHGGRIINTIAGGFAGDGGMAIYMSAKSAIASFTATAAVECEPLGILVNGISPLAITRQSRAYFFRTGTVSKDDTATISHLGPHQNSPLVVYLASDASAGVTGRLFSIYPEAFSPTSAIALREQWWEVGESVTRPGWSVTDLERVIPTLIHRPRSTFGRSVADPNALQRG